MTGQRRDWIRALVVLAMLGSNAIPSYAETSHEKSTANGPRATDVPAKKQPVGERKWLRDKCVSTLILQSPTNQFRQFFYTYDSAGPRQQTTFCYDTKSACLEPGATWGNGLEAKDGRGRKLKALKLDIHVGSSTLITMKSKTVGGETCYVTIRAERTAKGMTLTPMVEDEPVVTLVTHRSEGQDRYATKIEKIEVSSAEGLSSGSASESQGYDWKKDAKIVKIPQVSQALANTHGSRTLDEIWKHAKQHYVHIPDRNQPTAPPMTYGHESLHYLHSEHSGNGYDFIYLDGGRGLKFRRPTTPNLLSQYLPRGAKQLAESKYKLYSWNCGNRIDNYFGCYFDEFGGYISTAQIATEMVEANQYNIDNQDAVDGAMALLYYTSAMLLATADHDQKAFEANKNLKAAFAAKAEQAMDVVNRGVKMTQFNGFDAKKLKAHFVSSPENKKIRNFLTATYGAEWTRRVFGF